MLGSHCKYLKTNTSHYIAVLETQQIACNTHVRTNRTQYPQVIQVGLCYCYLRNSESLSPRTVYKRCEHRHIILSIWTYAFVHIKTVPRICLHFDETNLNIANISKLYDSDTMKLYGKSCTVRIRRKYYELGQYKLVHDSENDCECYYLGRYEFVRA